MRQLAERVTVVGETALGEAVRQCVSDGTIVFPEPTLWLCGQDTDDLAMCGDIAASPALCVLVSNPIVPGTTRGLAKEFPSRRFAYVVETVRRATGLEDFVSAPQLIIGTYQLEHELSRVFRRWPMLQFVSIETAELTKLALNALLSLHIHFAHEMEALASGAGADAYKVAQALRGDPRISPLAPLLPGPSWGGSHLARDVDTLQHLGELYGIDLPLINQLRSEA